MFIFCSDIDATMLACVAFSLPNLEAFEINMAENVVNRITGYMSLAFKHSFSFLGYVLLLIPCIILCSFKYLRSKLTVHSCILSLVDPHLC